MQKIQLTEHFNLPEFTRSATAEANGIKNDLDYDDDRLVISNLRNLCEQVLEPLREFADAPVIVSSGYRCKRLNELVGGASSSQHMTGEVVDIVVGQSESHRSSQFRCEAIKQWFLFIQNNCHFDQLILESKGDKRWVHVSCRSNCKGNWMLSRTMRV